jgi:hypothetical protein
LLLVFAAGCSSVSLNQEIESVPLFTTSTQAKQLCIEGRSLPQNFEIIAKEQIEDLGSNQLDLPIDQELLDASSGNWITGALLIWVLEAPSVPGEDADGFMTPDEIANANQQAREEELAAPFTSAACSIHLYATPEAAQLAWQSVTKILESSTDGQITALPEGIQIADETKSVAYVVSEQHSTRPTTHNVIVLSYQNVLAVLRISAPCGTKPLNQECTSLEQRAQALFYLQYQRLVQRTALAESGVASQTNPQPDHLPERAWDQALLLCPPINYLGCVEEFVARVEAGTRATLCRSALGGWFFEQTAGNDAILCSDDESTVVLRIGTR